ncbi:hypothetical protein E4198_17535 [Streptomyces sp. RKND-216]|uniref:hypothetical protein n=1 Tax=Streptomyces sp. RKND-216 TaxID=2562581 RepID=UPI00109E07E6|nr:hypothetical protein [Streptomyces sp. RKND-216]THA26251.1 hypothetical protein E4198_17535 [Streptomyces sp. RKND-216]
MRFSIKNVARTAALAGVTVAALGTATTAQAESRSSEGQASLMASCPSSGYIFRYKTCTTLSSGVLTHAKYTNDVTWTEYEKDSGSRIYRRLGYQGNGNGWGGWGYQSSGETDAKTWTGLEYCNATIGVMEVSGQQTFQTPLADC